MEYGIQLFGCMDIFRKNPVEFLRKTAEMGYTLIEPCAAFGGFELSKDGVSRALTPAEFASCAETAKSFGLRVESCHVFGDLAANMEALNKLIRAHGIKFIMTGSPEGGLREKLDGFAETLKSIAAGIKKSGARLCVHNGAADIRETFGGKTFLEAALDRCGGEVGAQIDAGWVLYGGKDPLDYMKRVEPYLWTFHYKDIKKDYKTLPASAIHTRLGAGCLDVRKIHEYARKLGVPQLIDQDKSDGDMMDDLEKSVKLLRSLE